VEALLENRGENAYSTVLNISFSRNLQFASLIPKVRCWELGGWEKGVLCPVCSAPWCLLPLQLLILEIQPCFSVQAWLSNGCSAHGRLAATAQK